MVGQLDKNTQEIIKQLGINSQIELERFLNLSEEEVQREYAHLLRKKVIQHLQESELPVAKGFREEFKYNGGTLGTNDYKEFLNKQGKNGSWGTHIEFSAFCELFGFNGVVTTVTNGNENTWNPPAFEPKTEKNLPTLHLYNTNNTHWHINEKTKGDGNCLYNAGMQTIWHFVKGEVKKLQKENEIKVVDPNKHNITNRRLIEVKEIIPRQEPKNEKSNTTHVEQPKQNIVVKEVEKKQPPKKQMEAIKPVEIKPKQPSVERKAPPIELKQSPAFKTQNRNPAAITPDEQIKADYRYALTLAGFFARQPRGSDEAIITSQKQIEREIEERNKQIEADRKLALKFG